MLRATSNGNNGNTPAAPTDMYYFTGDMTGATNVAAALETAVEQNPGKFVKIPDNATIWLEGFGKQGIMSPTRDVFLDFGKATILQSYNQLAIDVSNTDNASAEVAVSALMDTTINTDSPTTRLTIGSTLAAKEHDWVVIYTNDPNPSKMGGFIGEGHQLLADENSLNLYTSGYLWRTPLFTNTVRVRKLDATRRLIIKGGVWKPNLQNGTLNTSMTREQLSALTGNPVMDRKQAILVTGFVEPLITDTLFDNSWSVNIDVKCCAAPKVLRHQFKNAENTANLGGYPYGVRFYGMVANGTVSEARISNGRHAGFTTDGYSGGTATRVWYDKGYPTAHEITNISGFNNHGSLVDEHEEAAGGVYSNVRDHTGVQGTITPFTGSLIQIRGFATTLTDFSSVGGTRGVKVHAIDHGMPYNEIVISGGRIRYKDGGNSDGGRAIEIISQVGLVNKPMIDISDIIINNADVGISVGELAQVSVTNFRTRRVKQPGVARAGSKVISSLSRFDFRGVAAGNSSGWKLLSDATNGGATVQEMTRPIIVQGDQVGQPYAYFDAGDSIANKFYYAPGLAVTNTGTQVSPFLTNPNATTLLVSDTAKQLYLEPVGTGFQFATNGLLIKIGDSFYGNGISNAVTAGGANSCYRTQRDLLSYFQAKYNHPYEMKSIYRGTPTTGWGSNVGIGGSYARTTQERLYRDVLTQNPTIVMMNTATNDLKAGYLAETLVAIVEECYHQCVKAGVRNLFIQCPFPRNTLNDNQFSAAQEAERLKYNAAIAALEVSTQGYIVCLNSDSVMIDPATGLFNAAYTIDGLHPNSLGVYMFDTKVFLPKWLAAGGKRSKRAITPAYDAAANPQGNLLTNPTLTGTTGTVTAPATGQTPTSWRGEISTRTQVNAAFSVVTGNDIDGNVVNKAQIAITSDGTSTDTEIVRFRPSADITTNLTAWTWVEYEFELFIDAKSANNILRSTYATITDLTATIGDDVSFYRPRYSQSGIKDTFPTDNPDVWIVKTWPLLLKGTTGVRAYIYFDIDGSVVGSRNVSVCNAVLKPVSDPKIFYTESVRVHTLSANAYVFSSDRTIAINKTTAGATTVIASPVHMINDKVYHIADYKGDAATNNITITPASGTINGAASLVININFGSVDISTDGTNIFVR